MLGFIKQTKTWKSHIAWLTFSEKTRLSEGRTAKVPHLISPKIGEISTSLLFFVDKNGMSHFKMRTGIKIT